ncbi:MAG: fibronectin type III domain-containing protein, partial [Bacteroidales bacterium]
WTPRHNPASYAGFMPQYTLELWEVMQEGRHAEDVVRSQPPLISIPLTSPFYRYSLSDPLLTPGKTYVWRVRAEDPQRRTGFSNEGWSAAFTFRYALPCQAPELKVSSTGQNTIHLAWYPQPEHQKYLVQFRPYEQSGGKSSSPGEWHTAEAALGKASVDRLRENSDYEFRLAAFCRSQEPAYSAPVVAHTSRREFTCGEELSYVKIDNFNPLPMLRRGEIIIAAGFEVRILEVEGSNGYFTGRGVVTVPWMSYIKLEVAFQDIYVNELYQLAEGQIHAVYRTGNTLAMNFPTANRRNRILNAYPSVCDMSLAMDSTIISVTLGLDGQIVIATQTGEQKIVDPGQAKTIAITSPEGKQYLVERTEKGTTIFEAPPIVNQDRSKPTEEERGRYRGKISFSAHPQQIYGIDLPGEDDPPENYKRRTSGGEITLVGWKAVAEGRTDRITAEETDATDSVYFSMGSGNVVMSRREEGNRREILLAGNGQEQEDALYGWITERNPKDSTKR